MLSSDFEKEYLAKFFNVQRLQWENYALLTGHDLSVADQKLQQLVSGVTIEYPPGRRGQVLKAIVQRSLVDMAPQVVLLRNRLDNPDNYSKGPTSALAQAMRPDVLKLMELRNCLARTLGYNSYVDLVFFCEELDLVQVVDSLELFVQTKLPMAKDLLNKYNIEWKTWFSDLHQLGMPVQADALHCVEELAVALGLEEAMPSIQITVKDQPIAGIAVALDVPRDIRVLLQPVKSLAQLSTLYHEFGHALGHAFNTQSGIFKTWTAIHDETMAMTIEGIGLELFGDDEMKALSEDLATLEDIRCALSFLFELDAIDNPEAAEDLYRLHYGRLVANPDCSLWALDSFRSIDPVYIHNYVLGRIIADRTLPWLKHRFGQDPLAWGTWLRENWFKSGRSKSLGEKTEQILHNQI